MKKLMYFLSFILFTGTVQSQNSGIVIYDVTRQLEIKLQGDAGEIANRLPKERKSKKELLFNEQSSLFRNVEEENDDDVMHESSGGATIMIRIREPEQFVYSDLKQKINTEQKEFMSRIFLIDTPVDTLKWKLTGNQKSLLDRPCMEAELMNSKNRVVAWFAPGIPVSTGPEGYTGLPGLILALDIDHGKSVYNASKLDLIPVSNGEIKKPNEGKKVSKNEFDKIVEEKMKEMEQTQKGGVFIIKEEHE